MTVVCTGAEFNAFMADKDVWRDGFWYDDVGCEVNGKPDELDYSFEGEDVIQPDATVVISGGEYHRCQEGFINFDEKLAGWLKARTVRTLIVEVPRHIGLAGITSWLEWEGCTVKPL